MESGRKALKICAVLLLCLIPSVSLWFWLHGQPRSPYGGLTKFSSEAEFSEYLSRSRGLFGLWTGGWGGPFIGAFYPAPSPLPGIREEPSRISETTVQVRGIDEPDVAKTDGRHLYFSDYGGTRVIRAFPPSQLSVASRLDRSGELLLLDNLLVLLSPGGISGYGVSEPSSPRELWNVELEAVPVSARLYREKVYLVIRIPLKDQFSFPLRPLKIGDTELLVRATDIYRPPQLIPTDSVYTALILDPREGKVEKSLSFLGYSDTSVVYMSKDSLYLTYTYSPSFVKVFGDFLLERYGNLLPTELRERINRLMGYELSEAAKMVELGVLLSSAPLSWEELDEGWENYLAERKRELESTHLVKIALEDFEIVAQAEVPGRPLNQFSLDEEEGYLRLATTVEPWMLERTESTNDVYILDLELKVVGSLKDLGRGEEIYAVRFLGDRGYVVTFRETDPLHVIDLSDPSRPWLAGELEMPGYSSYLHPIGDDLLLGIGREGRRVKVSLFDVSSPSRPLELDKLLLEEYWSEILETHHAFLLDPDHEVFFLPASLRGYVLSYREKDLEVVKVVEGRRARRALYLDDYLYVLSEGNLTVLDERTWETAGELEF